MAHARHAGTFVAHPIPGYVQLGQRRQAGEGNAQRSRAGGADAVVAEKNLWGRRCGLKRLRAPLALGARVLRLATQSGIA